MSMKSWRFIFVTLLLVVLSAPTFSTPLRAEGRMLIGVSIPGDYSIYSITVAPDKNMYFLVQQYLPNTLSRYLFGKLTPSGNLEWVKATPEAVDGFFVNAIAVTDRYVYVGGAIWNSSIFYHAPFIAKLNTDGTLLKFITIGHGGIVGWVTVATDESVYVSGCLLGHRYGSNWEITSCVDGFIAKFSPDLSLVWLKRITTTEPYLFNYKSRVVVTSDGYIYVALDTSQHIDVEPYIGVTKPVGPLVVKLNSGGNPTWIKLLTDNRYWSQLTADSSGFIYVTGFSDRSHAGVYDIFVAKIASNGNLMWYKTFGSPSLIDAYEVTMASDGYLYVTGYTTATDENGDAFVAKLDLNGNMVWYRVVGYPNSVEEGDVIYVSPDRCLLAIGGVSFVETDSFFIIWGYTGEVEAEQVTVQDYTNVVSFESLDLTVDSPSVPVYIIDNPPIEDYDVVVEPLYGEGVINPCSAKVPASGVRLGGCAEPLTYDPIVALATVASALTVTIAVTRRR